MKKHKLFTELSFDFGLIGISCHEKSYKLVWAINNNTGLNLVEDANIEIVEKGAKESTFFPRFSFENENGVFYNLVSNKTENGFLIPELSNFDYFMQLTGNTTSEIRDSLIKEFRNVDIIMASLKIDPKCLRNKDRFLY